MANVHQGFWAVIQLLELLKLLVDVANLIGSFDSYGFDIQRILDFSIIGAVALKDRQVLFDPIFLRSTECFNTFLIVYSYLLVEIFDASNISTSK